MALPSTYLPHCFVTLNRNLGYMNRLSIRVNPGVALGNNFLSLPLNPVLIIRGLPLLRRVGSSLSSRFAGSSSCSSLSSDSTSISRGFNGILTSSFSYLTTHSSLDVQKSSKSLVILILLLSRNFTRELCRFVVLQGSIPGMILIVLSN